MPSLTITALSAGRSVLQQNYLIMKAIQAWVCFWIQNAWIKNAEGMLIRRQISLKYFPSTSQHKSYLKKLYPAVKPFLL